MKCMACDSEAMVRGTVLDGSGTGTTKFQLDDTPIWKSLFGAGSREFIAYGCVHCGHLQLAVDFTEKDLQRYQQFEGEQPDLLKRINSEPERPDSE